MPVSKGAFLAKRQHGKGVFWYEDFPPNQGRRLWRSRKLNWIFAENSLVSLRSTEIYNSPRKAHLPFSCRVFYLCRSTLIVTIHKVQLKEHPTDQDTGVNYYVKLKILPLNHRSFQTEAINESKNPEFMQTFEFRVTYEKLQAQSLKMTLWCFDRFSQHEPLGHHTVHLAELEARGLSLSREILLFRDIYAVQKVTVQLILVLGNAYLW